MSEPPAMPRIEVDREPSDTRYAAVVSLVGEYDRWTSAGVEKALETIDGNVLVDVTACSFMDSTVLGVICTSRER